MPGETELPAVCEIQQRRREEQGDQGEVSDAEWVGFFLPGTPLDTGDSVEVPGEGVFELVGAPWHARNLRTQQESHVEATLRRTAGAEDAS